MYNSIGIDRCPGIFFYALRILEVMVPMTHNICWPKLPHMFSQKSLEKLYGRVIIAEFDESIASATILFNTVAAADRAHHIVRPIFFD